MAQQGSRDLGREDQGNGNKEEFSLNATDTTYSLTVSPDRPVKLVKVRLNCGNCLANTTAEIFILNPNPHANAANYDKIFNSDSGYEIGVNYTENTTEDEQQVHEEEIGFKDVVPENAEKCELEIAINKGEDVSGEGHTLVDDQTESLSSSSVNPTHNSPGKTAYEQTENKSGVDDIIQENLGVHKVGIDTENVGEASEEYSEILMPVDSSDENDLANVKPENTIQNAEPAFDNEKGDDGKRGQIILSAEDLKMIEYIRKYRGLGLDKPEYIVPIYKQLTGRRKLWFQYKIRKIAKLPWP